MQILTPVAILGLCCLAALVGFALWWIWSSWRRMFRGFALIGVSIIIGMLALILAPASMVQHVVVSYPVNVTVTTVVNGTTATLTLTGTATETRDVVSNASVVTSSAWMTLSIGTALIFAALGVALVLLDAVRELSRMRWVR